MAAEDLGNLEWERSKISQQDINMLKKLGISGKQDAIRFPKEESYPAPPMQYRPFMKELVRFGTQFIGYRDHAGELEEKLAEANRRADALAIELEQSKSAHMKTVEDLQKRLDDAKKALEENVTQHSAREKEILSRLETQSRRFVRRTHQEYELDNPKDDELLDALSLLEIHGTEARNGLAEAEAGCRSSPISSIKRRNPQFSLILPSASLAMKTLDSNFVKKD
ncbi:hypothetical protein QYE76_027223 [Lolium multiflorum]|uniref:Uncharacterized protein n=1 Tax=Lolium multiflorum TaxID=4521 RepID=A0AAD8VDF7_LOLMU|nr:hypothetical protein QYE76_027223 [Lolium multiflorum]